METSNSSDRPSIDMLNLEKTQTYIGGIVLTSVLVIIGVLGNVHVLIVFGFKMKSSNHTTFILCLGIVDMIACSVGMPLTILDLTRPFTFHDDISCKIGQLVNYFMSASSALILLTITVDRYRKICHPMSRQLSNCMAKIICAIIICLSFTLSMPTFFYFGRNTVQLEYANITVTRCSTTSKYVASRLPLIFNAVLAGLALTVFTVLTVLYTLIIRAINKRGKFKYQQSNGNNRRPAVLSFDEMKTTLDGLNRPQESEDSIRPAVYSLDKMKTTLDGLNWPQESEDSRRPAVYSLDKMKTTLDGLNWPQESEDSRRPAVLSLDKMKTTLDGLNWPQESEDSRRPAVYSLDKMKTTLDGMNWPQESEDSRRPAVLSLDKMKTTLDGLNWPQESEDSRRPAVYSLDKMKTTLDGLNWPQESEDSRRPAVLSLDEMKTTLDGLNRAQKSEDSRRPAVLSLHEMKTTLDGLNRCQESEDSRRPAECSLNKSLDGLNKHNEKHPVVMSLDRLNKTQDQTSSAAQTNSANNLSLTSCVEYQSPEHTLKDDSYHRHVTNQPDLARETARIAIIFFVIVVIFFISYLPNLFLTVNIYMNYDYFHHLSKEKAILYNTFKWFFFINNAANPIVYLFLDVKFRSHLKSFYCKLIKPFKQIGLFYPQQ